MYRWLPHYTIDNGRVMFLESVDLGVVVSKKLSELVAKNNTFSLQEIERCIDRKSLAKLFSEGVMVGFKTRVPGSGSGNGDILVFQPHSDDLALSCSAGMTKFKYENNYNIHCVTVFSHHSVKGFPWLGEVTMDDNSYSELRKMEDRIALDYLSSEVTFWEYEDALKRGTPMGVVILREGIFKREEELIPGISKEIVEIVEKHQPVMIFIPAAIGWHYDHRITYMAAIDALKGLGGSFEVFLYEDFPYCESRYNYWSRLEEISAELWLEPIYLDIADFINDKSVLVNFYKSQLKGVNLSQVKQRIAEIARSTVIEGRFRHRKSITPGMALAERFWQVKGFKLNKGGQGK